jgi:hypothetical protein
MAASATCQFNSHGGVELAPLTYWNEAIPMATLNATIQFFGKGFDLQGFGGHWCLVQLEFTGTDLVTCSCHLQSLYPDLLGLDICC